MLKISLYYFTVPQHEVAHEKLDIFQRPFSQNECVQDIPVEFGQLMPLEARSLEARHHSFEIAV